jgi:hypothetical protein
LQKTIIAWDSSYPYGGISRRHLELKKLVIVAETGIPDTFYRDRQAILEMDEILRRFTKNPQPLRVDLVHAVKDGRGNTTIFEAKRTNVEEWLPNPFSPGVFRMDDVMEKQLRKLTHGI